MGECGIELADRRRIDELRRRVLLNPASIAFAALAEEYRRASQFEEAIETCRIGLRRHPAYLSPRVTLAQALFALGRVDEARAELERVLQAAPDNPAARRVLEEIDPALPALEAFLAAIQRVRAATEVFPHLPLPPTDR
jgi:tetratricopeptide (TPR) repeat protein